VIGALFPCVNLRAAGMTVSIGNGFPTCVTWPPIAAIDWNQLDWANLRQLIIAVAVLAALVAIGVYVVSKLRNQAVQKEPPASELLTKFRELHSRGVLSDEEFRTIKTTLTERLQSELDNRNDSRH
jgi:hypothetical protein